MMYLKKFIKYNFISYVYILSTKEVASHESKCLLGISDFWDNFLTSPPLLEAALDK